MKLPLFSSKRTEDEIKLISFILKRFGYKPKEVNYFVKAITHKSIVTNSKDDISNERLEFLGDAILDAVVAEHLFLKYPENDEGYLTKLKSKIVNRKTLSDIGESMEIRLILKYNQSRTINLSTLEGNAFEAIIGAIYLDGGYEKAKQSLNNYVFRKYLNFNRLLEEEIDFKSKLFIWCQRKKLHIDFFVVKETHENGQWCYEVVVIINKKEFGKGSGLSKKSAEQVAAKETLQLIGEI
ncbi:MAG: ribonuclease III [Flavobacteriales bacterium]|nr:ribonuclease III [Flavobacteriales bacterium]NCA19743.1 ribonuclease III [Crocinitomicaceae bacterium]